MGSTEIVIRKGFGRSDYERDGESNTVYRVYIWKDKKNAEFPIVVYKNGKINMKEKTDEITLIKIGFRLTQCIDEAMNNAGLKERQFNGMNIFYNPDEPFFSILIRTKVKQTNIFKIGDARYQIAMFCHKENISAFFVNGYNAHLPTGLWDQAHCSEPYVKSLNKEEMQRLQNGTFFNDPNAEIEPENKTALERLKKSKNVTILDTSSEEGGNT